MRLLAALGSVILGAGVLVIIALVNGGYVYRVECPRAGGSTETEWTYRWNSVIPYVGYERSGCETRPSTRVALDAVGLWKLDADSAPDRDADHSSDYPPELVSAMVDNCAAGDESRAFCECASNEITLRLSVTEFEQVAVAMQAGSGGFSDVPEDLRDKVRDATLAAEPDCR